MARLNTNKIRIIGGTHRGQKLHFPDVPGLRPTSDRIRETLFNWLTPMIAGARCLDLFAGSGALSFEAISRGAKEVIMVDQSPVVVNQLRANLALLKTRQSSVVQADAFAYIESVTKPFDIIFLDPPFALDVLPECIESINRHQLCHDQTQIYLEAPKKVKRPDLPDNWQWHRNKTAGNVGYHLIHCY
jgi:16S rRNA (guanine966-N2)-methyltransferase